VRPLATDFQVKRVPSGGRFAICPVGGTRAGVAVAALVVDEMSVGGREVLVGEASKGVTVALTCELSVESVASGVSNGTPEQAAKNNKTRIVDDLRIVDKNTLF